MKNKLLALLAALLLSVSLLPAQALAASDPDSVEPPVIMEPEEPGDPVNPSIQRSAPPPEDPGLVNGDH